jgi:hypothetical protein
MAYPSRTESLDDLYTAIWNNRKSEVTDNIFTATPTYQLMKAKGGITLDGTGGRYLEIPLSYAKNETVSSLDRGDTISISDTKFLTVAQFEWKFVAGSIVRYYVDDAKNKSKQAHLNLANAKIDNLQRSMIDKFETFIYGDGTGNNSKDPDGFGNIVAAAPTTGTVGNINRATYSWWRNKTKTATGAASVYLLSDMRTLFNNCSLGQASDVPDAMVTDQTSQELYEDEVQEQKMIMSTGGKETADAMFAPQPTFKGKPVLWSAACTAGYMYFLNFKYIGLNVDPDINMTATEWKSIPNQLDRVMQIVWKGNCIASRCASLGVLITIAA